MRQKLHNIFKIFLYNNVCKTSDDCLNKIDDETILFSKKSSKEGYPKTTRSDI